MNKSTRSPDELETRLLEGARRMTYPPTPDVTGAVLRGLAARPVPAKRRAWRFSPAMLAILLAALLTLILAVPPVRAAVLEWIRIGAVRIFLVQPTSTPTPLPGMPTAPPDAPSPTPLGSALDLTGETSLAEAREKAGFPIRLPPDFAAPDRVFLQYLDLPSVVMVWMDQARPEAIRFVLSATPSESVALQKMAPPEVTNTSVGGQPAYWVTAPYLLVDRGGEWTATRLIASGHTLIWTVGDITYRLESELEQDEAIRLAESLR